MLQTEVRDENFSLEINVKIYRGRQNLIKNTRKYEENYNIDIKRLRRTLNRGRIIMKEIIFKKRKRI